LALQGAPFRRGLIYKITVMSPRKPNSAKRKIAKVKLVYNKKKVFANIPGLGHTLHEYGSVIVRGGSAKDLPGVNYTLVRGLLDFIAKENFTRKSRRSKYGVKKVNFLIK
jgi:small subunit ribosomal protein S12